MSDNKSDNGGAFGFFSITPAHILAQITARALSYAKDAGLPCSMPGRRRDRGCAVISMGVRCETCARRVCMAHAFWSLAGAKLLPYCAYCVIEENAELFDQDEDA